MKFDSCEMSLKIKMSIICFQWASSKGVSTTYNCWLDDYTFSPPWVRLRSDYAIIPEAFDDSVVEIQLPDYTNISHGSNMKVVAVPPILAFRLI